MSADERAASEGGLGRGCFSFLIGLNSVELWRERLEVEVSWDFSDLVRLGARDLISLRSPGTVEEGVGGAEEPTGVRGACKVSANIGSRFFLGEATFCASCR